MEQSQRASPGMRAAGGEGEARCEHVWGRAPQAREPRTHPRLNPCELTVLHTDHVGGPEREAQNGAGNEGELEARPRGTAQTRGDLHFTPLVVRSHPQRWQRSGRSWWTLGKLR